MTTAKEMLEIAAHNIKEIDLNHYSAMYQINDIANSLINASALLGKELFNNEETHCDDCDAVTTVTLEPYGNSKMAVISCPNCGVSYDTNLDESEVN